MEGSGIGLIGQPLHFCLWVIGLTWTAVIRFWKYLVELQSEHPQLLSPQTLFGLIGSGVGVWKYWEGSRKVYLFRRFERMIEGIETQLVKARSDLLDAMNRPGPGLLIQPPVFVEKQLRLVLARRKLHTAFALLPISQKIDRRLENAIGTCDRNIPIPLNPVQLRAT
jgi:hypothetical protein